MSTDVRSKIIQSDGSFGFWLANLIKKIPKIVAMSYLEIVSLD